MAGLHGMAEPPVLASKNRVVVQACHAKLTVAVDVKA
jgi:hypothetical protein